MPIVTLQEAKSHLRVDYSADDGLIAAYIDAAVATFQRRTRTLLGSQTRTMRLSTFHTARLEWAPLVSLTSVTYLDESDMEQTLSASLYRIDGRQFFPSVVFYGSLPATAPESLDPVTITYQAGLVATPPDVRICLLQLISTYYRDRESSAPVMLREVPFGAKAIMDSYAMPRLYARDDA
jgi:uncharacterized phiE125 gp8 family phage protein